MGKLNLRDATRIKNNVGEVYELKTQSASWVRPNNVHVGNFMYEVDTRYSSDNSTSGHNTYSPTDNGFKSPSIYRDIVGGGSVNVDMKIYQNGTLISNLTNQAGNTLIAMPSPGIYQVELIPISGSEFNWLQFGRHYTLINILNWGNISWVTMDNMFAVCENLVDLPLDTPDLSQFVQSGKGSLELDSTFTDCINLNPTNNSINKWNTTGFKYFAYTFKGCSSFNTPLNNWDLSSAIDTREMFYGASSFDQDISNWDVSNVKDTSLYNMTNMFREAVSFNQDLSTWCVQNIPDEPTGFSLNATSWVLPKPNWGAAC